MLVEEDFDRSFVQPCASVLLQHDWHVIADIFMIDDRSS